MNCRQEYAFLEMDFFRLPTLWKELGNGGVSPGVNVYQEQNLRKTVYRTPGSGILATPFEDVCASVHIFRNEEDYINHRIQIK